jgi:ABC-2 type transport system ATP-binding protein
VLRHSLRQKSHLARIGIGYMPDSITIREDLTVLEYLQFYASLYATDPKARSRSPADALDLVGLAGREQARARDLSLGMQQRLSLARLLLHDPKVLLLDEPSAGLDPAGRIELKDLLARMAAIGKTILLSSHILSDVGQACNRIGILEKGKLLFHGTLPDLLSAAVPTRRFEVRLRGEGRHEQAREALRRLLPDVEAEVSGGALHVKLRRDPEEPARVFRALVTEGFTPSTFRPEQVDLEEAFFSLTRASAP